MTDSGAQRWSGTLGFTLAAIGSAVGLGSIWKFPYELGSNGGAAFLLFYVAGLVLIVVPLMLAEFAIGRRGGSDAPTSIAAVAAALGASPLWRGIGVLGILCGLLILSFYSVIGGWTLAYAVEIAVDGLPAATSWAAQARFDALLASPARATLFHAIFMLLTGLIVARGVNGGIEVACRVLMPLLAVLTLLLAAYAVATGDLGATLRFLFTFESSRFTARSALEALGLGFFSIGVGFGVMITYAAYAEREISLRKVAIVSVVFDTAISVAAGFAVFPLVFANDLDPAGGPGLVFATLPLAFARMPAGTLAAIAFFVLLFVAALASAMSMLEIAVSWLSRRAGWTRTRASLLGATLCFVGGLGTIYSLNVLEALDQLTSNILLPAGAFALSLFAGWALPARLLQDELRLSPGATWRLRIVLRYVAPAGIAAAALPALFG